MAMRKLKHTKVPVWIRLRYLPMEYWTREGLSTVASGVGKPLYPDAITRACTRLDFARVCVMIDVTHELKKHIIIITSDEEGGETPSMRNVHGLNKRDHQLALKDLVSEYRLYFLGILETHVRLNNVMYIQSSLLPQWKWFIDYSSVGNRIWLAWDENVVDVHILDLGDQFIHCWVTNMAVNEPIIITVVYGASEVIGRWNLWIALGTLAQQCSDIPWMVGGDFNAVRDLNEVCGISGDIRMAIEEFNAGILEAGLLPLPMQVEWFTWHNCSSSTRSLWKRLDRILINDRWLARFPTSSYHSITSWKSDHSPLVLHGYTQRRVMRRILQITYENGITHTNLGEVAHEFVSYYQNLLGGTRRRLSVDIRYLRPWARHCITDEEANQLLLPLSADDVKQAVFDIADDKAPRPDGYSSGFFKAAWPVVEEEVTRAVLDFFSTGKLLKQINSMILALIPKVHTPMSVNDFRPISCCNVLYKIIAKLLVQKISVLLDKIVSPCQTAFIPGRSIGDNIMLA
ncbi:UNVERIFIED_CONTAM: hypothetical protein Sindi_1285400 [Sesamum indicum]